MSERTVILDVRDEIKRGVHPFGKIMNAVAGLRREEALKLIAPFEPVPLYGMLAQQGFSHSSREVGSDHWEVLFSRSTPGHPAATGPAAPRLIRVDARGLEPPQPLVRILEELSQLPAGAELEALTDRRPAHLYAKLKERGFTGETTEAEDGSFVTRIRPL